jgi:hypothetical protein
MTQDVICKKGKCEYLEESYDYNDDCIDCSVPEQIEHELIKEQLN